ncbi:sensor histidine kinase [Costertonia aggregata]|uniref:histidine kinase n=1 Tax=Costertonia aggregata TaxID=343403 RepID=A0A7H9ASF6_9FLAO|nr:sensor histidine kinase [Costertonia aggregata]QLG46366.1 sensor histidine kinase [Costertonia aggregata]
MKKPNRIKERINDKTNLLVKFNYISSAISFLFGLASVFVLKIEHVIPHVFFIYPIVNLFNVFCFKKHRSLTTMAIVTSILSLVSTLLITVFSGGIESPFIFVFALIVLAGYISTSMFGKIYIKVVLAFIISIYLLGVFDFSIITNVVPIESKKLFSLFSILFSVYLLGDVFGKNLLKTHHKLYKSKTEIEQRIKEKEILLREVHHRVKNNLQTVSSLLNMQSRNTDDDIIKAIMRGSQNRVIVMAMVHEMLYMHKNLSKIEFKPYVEELSNYLLKSLNSEKCDISLNIDIPPEIELGIDTAIPLGLLINETVTNSLKYGFIGKHKGKIDIRMEKRDSENSYVLHISDDGTGFLEDDNLEKPKSLGLRLIKSLAKQLKGHVVKDLTKTGTKYTLSFEDIDRQYKRVA